MNKLVAPTLQEHLGLSIDPFGQDALADFFFVGGQRRFLAQRVVHALHFAADVVLLSGDLGVGKSRMLDEICIDLDGLADSCRIEANVMMDGTEIRRSVAMRLGLAGAVAQDNTTLIAAITQWQPVNREPLPIALIIDDAHLLAVPVLAECAMLARSAGGRMRLLLAGEPGLVTAWEQAGAGPMECIELPLLDRQETADYVLTRLQAVGCRAPTPFSDVQLRELYQRSRGNFAAIHQCAPLLLTLPAPPARQRLIAKLPVLKELPLQHIGIAVGLIAVVAAVIVFRGGANREPSATVATVAPLAKSEQRSVPLTLPPVTALPLQQPIQASLPEHSVAATSAIPSAGKAIEKIAVPPPTSKTLIAPPLAAIPANNIAVAEPVSKAPPREAATVVRDITDDERELLGWPADHYVLQILSGDSAAGIAKIMGEQAGQIKLYVYRAGPKARPRSVVVAGPYANREAAISAAKTLPLALNNQKPWPRLIASVQTDIRALRDGH